MQSKKVSNFLELKKTICKNYLKDSCPYGKECRFRHPPKQQEMGREVCKYYLQNKCRRGAECPFLHQKPNPEKKQRYDWLTFCLYYPNGQCKNRECRFLHISEEEKQKFRTSGKIGQHLVEQAMCKALLQDVTLDGLSPTCKDYLQGRCEWMSCPLLHVNRQEFSDAIVNMMREKFEAVLGSPERYLGHNKSSFEAFTRYREPCDYISSSLRDTHRQERYVPRADEAYGINYGKKPGWLNEGVDGRLEYDQQEYVNPETSRIIKGIYNLMKADAGLLRNADNYEVTDLRLKLNDLAEENARYRYEFSRMHESGYKPSIPSSMSTDNFKYQDIVRKLERENLEMRRELSMLHGREENNFVGSYNMHHENLGQGNGTGHGHSHYDMRNYGLPKLVSNRPPTYNPVKQKVNNQLKSNMLKQYKNPHQMKQGALHYAKAGYQKYPQVSKKNMQKKTVPVNSKVNQTSKKQLPSSSQGKPLTAKNPTQSKDNVESSKKQANSHIDIEGKPVVDAHSNYAESSSTSEAKCEDRTSNHLNEMLEENSDEGQIENKEEIESQRKNKNISNEEEIDPCSQELENEEESKTINSDASDKEDD